MAGNHTEEENQIIDGNAAYVLGMYDLYPNDDDIIAALKLKGIDPALVPFILNKVKIPSYQKRLKQGKSMLRTSIIVIVIWFAVYIGFVSLPDSETLLKETDDVSENIYIWTFRVYRELYYIILFIALLFFIAGWRRHRRYKKLLKQF